MGSDVGRRARQISSAISGGSAGVLREAALKAKDIHRTQLAAVVGGDLSMSGVGRRGARVGISFSIKGGTNPTALIRATGPVHLVERPTSAHVIRSRYGRRGGGGRRAVLNIPGIGYRRSARHPGTRGQEPFAKGQVRAKSAITSTMRKRTTAIIRRAM